MIKAEKKSYVSCLAENRKWSYCTASDLISQSTNTFTDAIYKCPEVQTVWKHSLAVGLLARELSKALRNRASEEAFVCGLLHDIGKIILLTHDREGYLEAMESAAGGEALRAEIARFGYSHAEVGALIARRSGLPDEVCFSILDHHDPAQAHNQLLVTYVVDAANMIANVNGVGLRVEDPSRLEYSESVIQLRLTKEIMESALATTETHLEDLIRAFQ